MLETVRERERWLTGHEQVNERWNEVTPTRRIYETNVSTIMSVICFVRQSCVRCV